MSRREQLVASVTVAVRLLCFWRAGVPTTDVYYWALGDNLFRQHSLAIDQQPTAGFEPLYPAFLAAARWIVDVPAFVILMQIAVAGLGAVFVFRLARSMSNNDRAASTAALTYAVYPYLVSQSVAWMEITLLSTILLGAWLAWSRERRLLAVAAMACAVLTRATLLPAALFSVVLLFRRDGWRAGAAGVLILAAFIAPLVVRTYALDGAFLPTRQGENLYVGNNAFAAQMIPRYDLDLLPDEGEARVRERLGLAPDAAIAAGQLDRELTREAWSYIAADPWRAIRAKAMNVVYFFSARLVPYEPVGPDTAFSVSPTGRVIVTNPRLRPLWHVVSHAIIYLPVLILGIAGAWRRHTSGKMSDLDALLAGSIIAVTAASVIYFPTTRMRAPLDPAFMAYAACAFGRWPTFAARRKQKPNSKSPA
jgi:hypothetical protein